MSLQSWLEDPDGPLAKEPIGLVEIRDAFHAAFYAQPLSPEDFWEGLRLCVAALVRSGRRLMLPNYQTGR